MTRVPIHLLFFILVAACNETYDDYKGPRPRPIQLDIVYDNYNESAVTNGSEIVELIVDIFNTVGSNEKISLVPVSNNIHIEIANRDVNQSHNKINSFHKQQNTLISELPIASSISCKYCYIIIIVLLITNVISSLSIIFLLYSSSIKRHIFERQIVNEKGHTDYHPIRSSYICNTEQMSDEQISLSVNHSNS